MHLIYIVDFAVAGQSGKEKATREKSEALKNCGGVTSFYFIAPKKINHWLLKIIYRFYFDFHTGFRLLRQSDFIVVQRVIILPFTWLICKLKGAKVVSECHGDLRKEIPLYEKPLYQKWMLYIASFLFDLNFYLSNGIIYVNPVLQNTYGKRFHKPAISCYNGADCNAFKIMEQSDARQALNIERNLKIFLFIGSVSRWHGVQYLIKVFNNPVISACKDYCLYIVGAKDNRYSDYLKTLIDNNNVRIIGRVDEHKANSYINAADFCLVSFGKTKANPCSPLKLYDYIACGKPVIVQADTFGYSDEVKRYGLGWTIDFLNVDQAAKELKEIATQTTNETIVHFKENNRKVAENEVSWKIRMEEWVRFLSKLHHD